MKDRRLFVDVLGLPLTGDEDYVFTEELTPRQALRGVAADAGTAAPLTGRSLKRAPLVSVGQLEQRLGYRGGRGGAVVGTLDLISQSEALGRRGDGAGR